jgi:hypothetical protein
VISMDKKYRTESGYDVILYAAHVGEAWGVHGTVVSPVGHHNLFAWTHNGESSGGSEFNLVEVKKKHVYDQWLNVYESGAIYQHAHRDAADRSARSGRIACKHVRVEIEEGEGL